MNSSYEKSNRRRNFLLFASLMCFVLALALMIVLRLLQIDEIVQWYNRYTDTLKSYENWIEKNGETLVSVLVILLNFLLKSVIPWFPISVIMVAAGVIFKWYYAVLINAVGLVILFTVRYFWGKRFGGGNVEKILTRYDKSQILLDKGRVGSKLALFVTRLIPCLPINAVSQLYGTTGMPYTVYLLISLAGFSYKLFSYTIIGRNVYDPLSAKFIVPLILLFVFSGFALLAISGAVSVANLRFKHSTKRKK